MDMLVLATITTLYIEGNCIFIRVGPMEYAVTCLSRSGIEQHLENEWGVRRHDNLEEKMVLEVREGFIPPNAENGHPVYKLVLVMEDGTEETFSWFLEDDWRERKGHIRVKGEYSKLY